MNKHSLYKVKETHHFHPNRLGKFEFQNRDIVVLADPNSRVWLFAVRKDDIVEVKE